MASGSKKIIYAALVGNLLIAVTKFAASVITGSSAMLSEGIHSLVDTGNQGLLLLGLRRAKRPPDEDFPFGHGKEVYFWSFVVALLIFAVGAGVSIYEGVHRVMDPHPIQRPIVNYFVLGLAIVFEGVAWTLALREFKRVKGELGYVEAVHRVKDPTTFVVLFEDSAAMLGLLVALAGVALGHATGNLYFDGAAAIVIGLILAATAIWLAVETKSLLIGESARSGVVQGIRELAGAQPKVEHVNEVATMHMGPEYVVVNLSLDFADTSSAEDIESTVSLLDRAIKRAYPAVKRVFVEAESRQMSRHTTASRDRPHA